MRFEFYVPNAKVLGRNLLHEEQIDRLGERFVKNDFSFSRDPEHPLSFDRPVISNRFYLLLFSFVILTSYVLGDSCVLSSVLRRSIMFIPLQIAPLTKSILLNRRYLGVIIPKIIRLPL